MSQNFLACDRDRVLLMAPSLRDWLPEDHFAWFVLDAVAAMDLSALYAAYRRDGHGRAAFDPERRFDYLLHSFRGSTAKKGQRVAIYTLPAPTTRASISTRSAASPTSW